VLPGGASLLLLVLVLVLVLWGSLDAWLLACCCCAFCAMSRVLMTSAGVLTKEATSPEHMLAAVWAHTPSGTTPLDSTADLACRDQRRR
jgi:hypothetical protein